MRTLFELTDEAFLLVEPYIATAIFIRSLLIEGRGGLPPLEEAKWLIVVLKGIRANIDQHIDQASPASTEHWNSLKRTAKEEATFLDDHQHEFPSTSGEEDGPP